MVDPTVRLARLERSSLSSAVDRPRLQRRARALAWGGNAWHLVEFGIAAGAGITAGSIALIGFGADSLIEGLAGFVIIWLFTGSRLHSAAAERRAQQFIAGGYFVLAAYVGVESISDLTGRHHPAVSWLGVGLAAFTAPTMPLLARAKRAVGRQLGSSAVVSEAGQNMICAWRTGATLPAALSHLLRPSKSDPWRHQVPPAATAGGVGSTHPGRSRPSTRGGAMPTVMAYHDVKDKDHWLASPRREEFFGPLGVTNIRKFVDPENPTRVGLVMDVPDLDAVMAAMESQAAVDAMAHDGVLPETLVILVEG